MRCRKIHAATRPATQAPSRAHSPGSRAGMPPGRASAAPACRRAATAGMPQARQLAHREPKAAEVQRTDRSADDGEPQQVDRLRDHMVGMRARPRPDCLASDLIADTLRGLAAPIGRTSCEADGKALHPCLTCRSTAWRDAGAVERGGLENRCTRERTVGSNPTPSASLPSRDILFPLPIGGRNPAECGRSRPFVRTTRRGR